MLTVLKEEKNREDLYGYARVPEHFDRIEYGRFRNVYLYITEKCQLSCGHCYMGERLIRAKFMPLDEVKHTLQVWRKLGGSKLSILGGEPTLHPDFINDAVKPCPLGRGYKAQFISLDFEYTFLKFQ